MKNMSILVVDDDPKIRTLLRNCLEGEDFQVLEASDADEAVDCVGNHQIDLVTLDLNLGGDDGFDVTKRLREISAVPIVMVTGKDDVIDRVVGLELGADDYITKPFHVREVIARVKSVLRRSQAVEFESGYHGDPSPQSVDNQPSYALCFDGMSAFPDSFELIDRDDNPCDLTSGDFKLLNVFLKHPKRTLSRDQLMDLIGGIDWTPLDRTIDNQVARLRKKIERNPSNPTLIKTVRGVGYVFATNVTKKINKASSTRD